MHLNSSTIKFRSYLKMQQSTMDLRGIDMHNSTQAFIHDKDVETKKDAIYMGWEWEHPIKIESLKPFLKEALSTPIRRYVNFRTGGTGMEMVSVPATLKAHKKYMEKYLFPIDPISTFNMKASTNDGVHVHIDKKHFTQNSLTKFIGFLVHQSNRNFINAIAGRRMENTNWCTPNPCAFTHDNEGKIITVNAYIDAQLNNAASYSSKGIALSTRTPYGTVEFRIFNTVKTKEKMYRNLEFTDALIRFTREAEPKQLNVSEFRSFVEQKAKDYPLLLEDEAWKVAA